MARKPKHPQFENGQPAVCPTGKPCNVCDGIVTVVRPIHPRSR